MEPPRDFVRLPLFLDGFDLTGFVATSPRESLLLMDCSPLLLCCLVSFDVLDSSKAGFFGGRLSGYPGFDVADFKEAWFFFTFEDDSTSFADCGTGLVELCFLTEAFVL